MGGDRPPVAWGPAARLAVRGHRREPLALAAAGVGALAAGRPRAAVEQLEQAVGLRPDDADLLNDLALAYIALAESERGEAQSWVLAYEAAERATRLDARALAASFNLALTFDALGIPERADAAWVSYLSAESDSAWAAEAMARRLALRLRSAPPWGELRARLRQPGNAAEVVARSPELAREEGGVLLAEWAAGAVSGDPGAAAALAATAEVAAAVSDANGDAMLEAAVAAVHAAERRGPSAVAVLASAHDALARGERALGAGDHEEAAAHLRRAHAGLEPAGSPFALQADFLLAVLSFYAGDYRGAVGAQRQVETEAMRRGCTALAARAAWNQALSLVTLEAYSEAAAAYERSRDRLEALGEQQGLGHVESALGLLRSELGDEAGAWEATLAALGRRGDAFLPVRVYSMLQNAAEVALRHGRPRLALHYLDGAVEAGREWGHPAGIAYALAWRGRVSAHLGDPATADLAEAEALLADLPPDDLRARIEGDLLLGRAEAAASDEPRSRVAELTAALERYQAAGYLEHAATVHLLLGQALEELEESRQAEEAYAASAAIYERRRGNVDDDLQITFFDQSHTPFEALARLAVARGAPWEALGWLERARARALRDAWPESASAETRATGLDPRPAIRRWLATDELVIEYSLLDDRLLTWAVGAVDELFLEATIDRERFSGLIRRLRSQITTESTSAGVAGDLYDLLAAQAIGRFPEARALVFVPTGELYNVPFVALRDPARGRWLVETHTVAVAPSAAIFGLARERIEGLAADGRPDGGGRFLLYGNPALDEADRRLGRLPAAEAEIEAVAALLPPGSATVRSGAEATRERFLSEAPAHTVLHLGVHAQANAVQPRSARLLLASSPGRPGSGSLTAGDFDGLHLDRTRLAVLGACDTARGFAWRIEGVESLARPFLVAGVPTVIATLWPVEDQAAAALLVELYRRLQAGDDPAQALAGAQRALLAGTDPALRRPRAWAGFQLLGGTLPSHRGDDPVP